MYAYSEMYIDDFQQTFGAMFQYVERDLEMNPVDFYQLFLKSRVSYGIENGNPRYLAGMSGVELARETIWQTRHEYLEILPKFYGDCGLWYWTGFVLSYYQWLRNMPFGLLQALGLDIERITSMYKLHEADITKFVQEADKIVWQGNFTGRVLAYYRKLSQMSQKALAEQSGVPLRMIQLYEQGQNDIRKASADYVIRLCTSLEIPTETLVCYDNSNNI